MFPIIRNRVLGIWLAISSLHALLLVLSLVTPIFRGTPLEAIGATALVVPYFLQQIGLPVLRELSGWGWASPNCLGWFLSAVVWLAFYGLVAVGVERLIGRR